MVGIAAAAARSWPLILATATRVGPGSTAADAVVVDLEDGVPDHDKHRAREVAAAYLQRADHPVWVRINDIHIAHWSADLDMISNAPAGVSPVSCGRQRNRPALSQPR